MPSVPFIYLLQPQKNERFIRELQSYCGMVWIGIEIVENVDNSNRIHAPNFRRKAFLDLTISRLATSGLETIKGLLLVVRFGTIFAILINE